MHPLLAKNLNLCLSIIKRPHLHHSTPATAASSEDLHRPCTIAPIHSNNYITSTYNDDFSVTDNSTMKSISDHSGHEADSDILLESASAPDFATVYASHRFFFSSPGRSNSIVDSSSAPSESDEEQMVAEEEETSGGGVPVHTYSPDPYGDFRRSMEEMVEARGLHDVKVSWKSLHELLLCYLSLNPKPTHKFIVAAFADLLVSLMSPPHEGGIHRPEFQFPVGSSGSCGCSCD